MCKIKVIKHSKYVCLVSRQLKRQRTPHSPFVHRAARNILMAKIIDIHCHDWLGEEPDDMNSLLRRILGMADKAGIHKLVMLGNVMRFGSARFSQEQIRAVNTATSERIRMNPGRMTGFCFMNPSLDPGFVREEIDRCVIDYDFRGIKLEHDLNVRDEKMSVVMNKAAEHGITVLQHSWYVTSGGQEFSSEPRDIACLAAKYPDVRIIMAHLTGCLMRGVVDVEEYPNVWIDTSGGQPVSGLVEYAVEHLGADRVVFGSDIPGRDFSCQLGRIYGAAIKKKDQEKILWKNAEILLKPTTVS